MSVPQNILDAVNAVQTDADSVAAAQTVQAQKQAALATAQAAVTAAQTDLTGATAAVTAAQAHEATDLAALQALLTQTYGPTA